MDTHNTPLPPAAPVPGDALFALKAQAQALQIQARAAGQALTRAAALETIARREGFKDWNAAVAAAKGDLLVTPATAAPPPWFDTAQPLPALKLQIVRPGDRKYQSAKELMRWARQLDYIATVPEKNKRSELMNLIGGDLPYVLVRDKARFEDTDYHLCDRGYDPLKGAVFSIEQLRALGLPAWQDLAGTHDGDSMVTVLSDEFMWGRDTTLLQQGARLLAHIAVGMTDSEATLRRA